jgi:hypothetical protein
MKRRGNPNWGKPEPMLPNGLSTFESLVKHLNLSPEEYKDSITLKEWVCQNKDHKYVPVELLKAWGLTVRAELSI